MKKTAAFLAGILSIVLFASCSGSESEFAAGLNPDEAAAYSATAAQPEAALLYAKIKSIGGYGVEFEFYGSVEVKNLAYNKNVVIHYSDRISENGAWLNVKNAACYYIGATSAGYEKWGFRFTEKPNASYSYGIQLAVKYDAAGKTYWDNNGGKNYSVSAGWYRDYSYGATFALGKQTHTLYGIGMTFDNTFHFAAFAKNVSIDGRMKIVYTTDGWKTTQIAEMTPDTNSQYYENTTFAGNDIVTGKKKLEFALAYEYQGVTYWDNNDGRNYIYDFSVSPTGRNW